MTWEDVLKHLLQLKETGPEVLQQKVCLVYDLDTIQYIELAYLLGSDKLAFVSSFSFVEETIDGE